MSHIEDRGHGLNFVKCHHFTSILRFSTKANFSAEAGCLVVSEAWVTWRVESSIQLGSHTGPAAADQPSHPKLIAAAPIASNSDIDVRQYSWTPSCLSLTGGFKDLFSLLLIEVIVDGHNIS